MSFYILKLDMEVGRFPDVINDVTSFTFYPKFHASRDLIHSHRLIRKEC